MANEKQLDILRQGVEEWNQWREEHPDEKVELREADLLGALLQGADLHGINLSRTTLIGTRLRGANLCGANLVGANLAQADLSNANITGVYLYGTARDDWIIDGIRCKYVFWDSKCFRQRKIMNLSWRPKILFGNILYKYNKNYQEGKGVVRMDEVNKIRKTYFGNGETKNELANRFTRSWNTIDTIVKTDREQVSTRGKRPGRKATVATEAVKNEIRKVLQEEERLKVKKKQRRKAAFFYKDLTRRGLHNGFVQQGQSSGMGITHILRHDLSGMRLYANVFPTTVVNPFVAHLSSYLSYNNSVIFCKRGGEEQMISTIPKFEVYTSMIVIITVLIFVLGTGDVHAITYSGKTWTEMDWQVTGDGLLTRDETTGREWLDVSSIGEHTRAALKLRLADPNDELYGFQLAAIVDVNEFLVPIWPGVWEDAQFHVSYPLVHVEFLQSLGLTTDPSTLPIHAGIGLRGWVSDTNVPSPYTEPYDLDLDFAIAIARTPVDWHTYNYLNQWSSHRQVTRNGA